MDKTATHDLYNCTVNNTYNEDNCLYSCLIQRFIDKFGCVHPRLALLPQMKDFQDDPICGFIDIFKFMNNWESSNDQVESEEIGLTMIKQILEEFNTDEANADRLI